MKKNQIQAKTIYYPTTHGLNGNRCGWLCRKLTAIADFVRGIPIIGDRIASKIDIIVAVVDTIDDVFLEGKGTLSIEYEPTPSESAILESWQTNRLMPFYRNLTLQLATISQQGTLTEQLAIANKGLQKMCIVENYFATNETNGLSTNAVYLRLELISKIFEPLYEMIEATFANQNLQNKNVSITFNSGISSDYSPLISTTQNFISNCLIYTIESVENSSVSNDSVPLVFPKTDTTQTITRESNDNLLFIGICIAGIIAVTILSTDKKKENKRE